MLDIALHSREGLIHLKDVAEREEISKKYLEQLVARLEADGLLRTVRGAGGGVAVTRSPSQITILEILQSLEGSLAPVECVGKPEICPRYVNCSARDLWTERGDIIDGFLGSVTLEDLCGRQRVKDRPAVLTYDI